jgi:hypothetical protein
VNAVNGWLKAIARRWLGLDGPLGLATTLEARDAQCNATRRGVDEHDELLRKIIPLVNDHTRSLQRFAVYERRVPALARVYKSMQAVAVREQRKAQAAAELAAPPVVEGTPPDDAEPKAAG